MSMGGIAKIARDIVPLLRENTVAGDICGAHQGESISPERTVITSGLWTCYNEYKINQFISKISIITTENTKEIKILW